MGGEVYSQKKDGWRGMILLGGDAREGVSRFS